MTLLADGGLANYIPIAIALSMSVVFAIVNIGASALLALVSVLLVVALYRPAPDAAPPGPLRLSALAHLVVPPPL